MEFEATVTYDVWDKIKEEKKLKPDGTPEKFGPFTGTAICTFKAINGKFRIILIPDDKCKETPTTKQSVTRFGLGETGKIKVAPIEPNKTVTVTKISAAPGDVCDAGMYFFAIKRNPGTATITVEAKVNGSSISEEETYKVTGILPSGAYFDQKSQKVYEKNDTVGAGFTADLYLLPKDVSFSKLPLKEKEVTCDVTGNMIPGPHNANKNFTNPGGGNVDTGCYVTKDTVYAYHPYKTRNEAILGTATFNIPLLYDHQMEVLPQDAGPVFVQKHAFLIWGNAKTTKINVGITRKPKEPLVYMANPTIYYRGYDSVFD